LRPLRAPQNASAPLLLAPTWAAALMPEAATTTSLRNRVTWYSTLVSATSTSTTLQTPVSTSTANAGQARRLNRRATARGASSPRPRRVGTRPARVIWPPTHTAAARTCRKSRIVVTSTGSTPARMAAAARSARSGQGGQHVAGLGLTIVQARPVGHGAAEGEGGDEVDRVDQVAEAAGRREVLVLVGVAHLLHPLGGGQVGDDRLDQLLGGRGAGGDAD